jgi:hypothetical protein
VQQDLGVAVGPLVERVVGIGRLGQGKLVRDEQRRRRLACDDQIAQGGVVPLDRALAGADPLPLGFCRYATAARATRR